MKINNHNEIHNHVTGPCCQLSPHAKYDSNEVASVVIAEGQRDFL